jgi:protein-disulfide isomerase
MKNDSNQNQLIVAIIVGALIVGGSMVFLGTQMGGGTASPQNMEASIQKGIDNYIAKQQEAQNQGTRKSEKVSNTIEDDDPMLGDVSAPITVVEFSDYECPFCKRFFENTLISIKEKYVETGQVKFVYRDFPLGFHKGAKPAAIGAECARDQQGDEAYFAYHDLIFQNQGSLQTETFKQHAQTLGLNASAFSDCFDGEQFSEEVDKDFADGQSVGVSGTPGFIVLAEKDESKIEAIKALEVVQRGEYINQYIETHDGSRMGMRISGAQPLATFEQLFEVLLK